MFGEVPSLRKREDDSPTSRPPTLAIPAVDRSMLAVKMSFSGNQNTGALWGILEFVGGFWEGQ